MIPAARQPPARRRIGQIRVHDRDAEGREVGIVPSAGEVIDDHHLVARREQAASQVHADETGPAEDQDLHGATAAAA